MPDIAANVSTTATLAIGGSASSVVDFGADHDWFRVNLTAGETYVFNLNGGTFADTFLNLYNGAGALLASNDDITFGDLNSQIRYMATTTGAYYLDASAFNPNDTGTYTISAVVAPPLPTYSLDQIADYLTTGYWGGFGYHFATTAISYNIQGLTGAEQALARLALKSWDDVGSFNFVETTASAQITFNHAGSQVAETSADGTSATIQISSDWNGAITAINSYTYQTYIHEIGHALGLGHGGPYNGNASYANDAIYTNDSWANSVMSYFSQDEAGAGSFDFLVGPQLADIIAIGNLYGLSTTTRIGDTTYGFNSNAGQIYNFGDAIYSGHTPALAIFDNGGTDTLDLSGYGQQQRIDLNAEARSDVGGEFNNVSIARGTVIENAIGGSGVDTITGNAANNTLNGGAGADILNGGEGSDTLIGGVGADTMNGGDGSDYYYVDNVGDTAAETNAVQATGGFDIVIATANFTLGTNIEQLVLRGAANAGTGNSSNNILYGLESGLALTFDGGAGDDVIYGSTAGGNTLIGGDGVDTLLAYGGNNTMRGGLGSDIYYTYTASDVISEAGGDGIDTVYSNHSIVVGDGLEQVILYGAATSAASTNATDNNIFFGNSANGAVTLEGGGGADVLFGGNFGDTLIGGDGVDLLFGFGGANNLQGGNETDVYYLESGLDTITETVGGGFDTAYAQFAGITTLAANVEQLILYGAATGGLGNSGDNYLFGHILGHAATLDGAGGNDYLLDSAFDGDVLTGGAGNDQLDLRSGGNDLIKFAGGSGIDLVYGFDALAAGGQDQIDLSGRGFNAASIGTSIIITAGSGETDVTIGTDMIRLIGVASGDLDFTDFKFA